MDVRYITDTINNPDNVEALTYKADSLLDPGEDWWALSLTNQAIDHDQEYALAYWQRACAELALGQRDEAVRNLETAILQSPPFKDVRRLLRFCMFICRLN